MKKLNIIDAIDVSDIGANQLNALIKLARFNPKINAFEDDSHLIYIATKKPTQKDIEQYLNSCTY